MEDMEKLLYAGRPCRVLLSFNPPFPLILLHLEENMCKTRKGIKSWIERLIVNLVEELGFRGTQFQWDHRHASSSGSGSSSAAATVTLAETLPLLGPLFAQI